jgi:allantoinase
MHDLVIRNGIIAGSDKADIAIDHGIIAGVGPELPAAREEIDANGLLIFPGLIDVHLHFNEPGRTEWEGGATGSRALAAGGGTLFFDMPLNSTPCTVSVAAFEEKRAALSRSAVTDFALWGGIIPGNLPELEPLAEAGVIGFKAFLCNSGLPEFRRADDLTLYDAMQVAARYGLPVAVHAESEEITAGLARRVRASGASDVRSYLASRPVIAEVEAIERAALLARETEAWLHIVHISSGRGVAAALEARARGANLTIETCPHYLFFTEEDLERIGAAAKCSPPLRPAIERDALWRRLLAGEIDIIASDHSPSSPDLKRGSNFFDLWGGIAGVQSTLAVLLEAGHRARGLSLENIMRMTAETPAQRFRIAGKGKIVPGYDADLALVDLTSPFTLAPDDLLQRHAFSPYIGSQFHGRVQRTLLRGQTIFHEGRITAIGNGNWVRPLKQESACTS